MSLLKIINGANNDKDFIPKIHEYIVDDVKTDKGQLVGTSNCFRKHAVKDFMTVKKLHHKTHGRQGIHMVLSITPDIPENSDEVYMDIADEIASYFSEYQSVYSVHKDTRHRHIHMVLNSVSYETGKKFSQSKQELNQLKGYFNHVLLQGVYKCCRPASVSYYSAAGGIQYLMCHIMRIFVQIYNKPCEI